MERIIRADSYVLWITQFTSHISSNDGRLLQGYDRRRMDMDDILIHAKMKKDLEDRTKRVLQQLQEHDLYLKLEKCKFERTEVEFLGTIISENMIRMDLIKLAGIQDWPSLTTVKQTQSFLGFGNYY